MKKIAMIMVVATLSWITTGTMNAETFVKVTDASTLQDGDKVIIGCAEKNEVSAGFSSTYKFLNAATATFANNKVTVDNPKIITLKKSGNYWNLYFGTKVIGHESGTSNLDGNKCRYTTKFAISIETNGTANIVSQTLGDDNAQVFFNHHNTLSRFSLYKTASPQTSIELYKLDESTIPEVVPTKVVLDKHEAELRIGASLTLTATVTPDQAEDKSVSWGSMNESVATVVNGVVTPVAVGTAKIWVKTTKGENVTDTCVVTILPALNTTKATYNIVQKADYLTAGAKVFFGSLKSGENYVMGRYEKGDNIKVAAATYKDDAHHSVESELQYAYTVQRAGDYYVFVDQDGYYMRTLSSSRLGKGKELDNYAKWEVGDFDQDKATVELKNIGCNKYLYYNHNADLFNIYEFQGVSISSNFSRIVLFSSEAPEWVDRVKEPKMELGGSGVTKVDGKWTMDYGKQDKWDSDDGDGNWWGDGLEFELTYGDLDENISVTITGTNASNFYLPLSGDVIQSAGKKTGSSKMNVYFVAPTKGMYTATLKFHTETAGVDDIEVILKAEAVEESGSGVTPELFDLSADHIYLNPTTDASTQGTDTYMGAEYTFKFSARNLAKALRLKWWYDTSIYGSQMFPRSSEQMNVYLAYQPLNLIYEELAPNQRQDLGKDDITDFEVYICLTGIHNNGTYKSELQFESYAENSHSDLAIDVKIPITVYVSPLPTPEGAATGMESIEESEISSQKIIRNGQMLIIRNGEVYSVTGVKIND